MRDQVLVNLGSAIRRARNSAGFSQEELADRANLHRTYIGGVERGERNVGFKNLIAIGAALNIPIHELVRGVEVLRRGPVPK